MLPIWELHPSILEALRVGNQLVLVAATGSGKTTQVPQMLLDAGIAGDRMIIVLQPRRVAARTVAARVAHERRCRLGEEVGYQIRFEDRTGRGTRICFVTEGILLRWLQDDPLLRDVGVLVFDEFHERNLLSDVALALAKDLQQKQRPDLKLLVMSATLEAEPVARYLAPDSAGSAPILSSAGRTFPVEIRWQDYMDNRPVTEQAADAVERIVHAGESGDVLVFMPGMSEILSTINALRSASLGERVLLLPLHGELQPEEQDRAFAQSELRKIIVATNVAETSITIDGVRHVIDSGAARIARYDAERGIGTLAVEEISRASADQRMGRAGRTAPGTCTRLWTESSHLNRPAKNTPEIQRADLAETVLLLHSLGIRRAASFDWLDKPDSAAVERAERLLVTLGALHPPEAAGNRDSDLTDIGRQMLRLPMHPRFSRMLVEASRRKCVPAAALCAALVSGRDLLMRIGRDDTHLKDRREVLEATDASDFYTLMRAYQYAKNSGFSIDACRRVGVHAQIARQVDDIHQQLLSIAVRERLMPDKSEGGPTPPPPGALEKCLFAGFVDQLAIRRDGGTLECDLTEGRHGTLARESVVQSRMMVVASIKEVSGRTGNITLLSQATAVEPGWLEEIFPQHLRHQVEHLFDRTHKRVAAVKLTRFFDLVISHEHQRDTDPEAAGRCLADAAAKGAFELPLFDHDLKQWIARVNLIAGEYPEFEIPLMDAAQLREAWIRAFHGCTLVKEAQAKPLKPALLEQLPKEQRAWLDELAPREIQWLEGKPLKLTYRIEPGEDGEMEPEAQVKLQDCLGAKTHPSIIEGRLPVRIWLHTPDNKRFESTTNWPDWRSRWYPRHRANLMKKFPGMVWP